MRFARIWRGLGLALGLLAPVAVLGQSLSITSVSATALPQHNANLTGVSAPTELLVQGTLFTNGATAKFSGPSFTTFSVPTTFISSSSLRVDTPQVPAGATSLSIQICNTSTNCTATRALSVLALTAPPATLTPTATTPVQYSFEADFGSATGVTAGLPTGAVTFKEGTTTLGTITPAIKSQVFAKATTPGTWTTSSNTATQRSVVADFDKDGLPDTLIYDSSTGLSNLHLLLGSNNRGDFNAETLVSLGFSLNCNTFADIVAGDFNNDGYADAAVLCNNGTTSNATIYLLINKGDATFTSTSISLGRAATMLAAGDMNKDGNLDLIVGGQPAAGVGASFMVMFGNGAGGFPTSKTSSASTAIGQQMLAVDLNNDGYPDLLTQNTGTTTVYAWKNDGTGGFPATANYNRAGNSLRFSVGRVAGSPYPNLLLGAAGQVIEVNNNADGTVGFGNTGYVTTVSNLKFFIAGDVTGDGSDDLITCDGTNIAVYPWQSSFFGATPSVTVADAQTTSFAGTGDFNADGFADVIALDDPKGTAPYSDKVQTYIASGVLAATLPTRAFTPGSHTITATDPGTVAFAPGSVSTTVTAGYSDTVSLTVTPATPTTYVGGTADETLKLTVTYASGQPNAAGTVTFYNNGSALGPFSVGTVNATTSASTVSLTLPAGSHSIYAVYNGDSNYGPSTTATQTYVINQAAQTINFPQPATPASPGTSVTLTATGGASGNPVVFSVVSGPATVSGTNGSTLNYTGAGTVVVAANQAGNANYNAAPQVTRTVTVTAAPISTTTSVFTYRNPSTVGQNVTFYVTVTGAASGPDLTGTATLYEGTTVLASGTVEDGSAYIDVSSLAVGTHNVTAVYSGSTSYTGSTSPAYQQEVDPIQTIITWVQPADIVVGTPLSSKQLNATATDGSGNFSDAQPGGLRPFVQPGFGQPNGSGNKVPGTFVYTPPAGTVLSVGSQTLSVTFTPDDPATYTGGSATVTINVTAAVTDPGTLTATPNPALPTSSVVLKATFGDATSPAGVPAGTVTFKDNTTTVGTGVLAPVAETFFAANQQSFGYNYTSGNPTAITADFNQDGIPDVLTLAADGSLSVLLGADHYGNLMPATQLNFNFPLTYVQIQSIVIADFNNDGYPDIAFLAPDVEVSDDTVTVLLNYGDGTFNTNYPITTYLSTMSDSMAAADFNKDGKIDIVLSGASDDSGGPSALTVLFGDGTGNFPSQKQTVNAAADGTQVLAADLNNDTYPDVVVSTPGAATSVFKNDGTGGFGTAPVYTRTFAGESQIFTAATKASTYPNLIVASAGASGQIAVVQNNKTAALGFSATPTTTAIANLQTAAVGDFNADGNPDVATYDGTTVKIYNGSATGTYSTPLASFASTTASNLLLSATADMNGDGYADLLTLTPVVSEGPSSTAQYYVTTGTASVSLPGATYTAGTHPLTATLPATMTYAAGTASTSLTVTQQTQTITFTQPASPVAIGSTATLSATGGASGNPVVFTVQSGPATVSGTNGTTITYNGAGTVVIAANQAGNANYAAAPTVTRSVTVNQTAQTINFTQPATPATFGTSVTLVATGGASGNPVVFSVQSGPATVSGTNGSTLTYTGVGTVVVAANQAGNANFSAAPTVTQTVTVAQAAQTITFTQPTSPVAVGSTATLSATGGASGNPVVFTVQSGPATVSGTNGTTITYTGAGTVVIAANQAGNANYAAAPTVTRSVTVSQTAQTITFTQPATPATVGTSVTLVATGGASGNPVTFSVLSGPGTVSGTNGSTLTYTGAGTVVVAADQAGNANYSAAPQVTRSVSVGQATQAITFNQPATPVAIGSTATLAATGGASGNPVVFSVVSGPATVSGTNGSTITYTGAGTVVIAANQAGNANYSAAPQVMRSVTVSQTSQAITFTQPATPATVGASVTLVATGGASGNPVTFSVLSGPGTVSGTNGSTLTYTGVGTVVVAADQAGNANYSAAPQVTRSVTVGQATQTITFNQPLTPVAIGDTATLSATGGASGNPVVFSVLSGPATVSGTNGSTITYTGAGTVVIAANQAGNANYSAAPQVTRSVTVSQTAQTISFTQPATPATFGTSVTLVATGGASGNPVVFSVVSGPATVSGTNGSTLTYTGVGTVIVAADQAGNANYSAAPQVTRTVTVAQATQTITFPQPAPPAAIGDTATLSATGGGSGNPVVFSVLSGPATVTGTNGTTITYTGSGTVVIAANQAGNANYAAAPQVTRSVAVGQTAQTINFTQPATPATFGTTITLVATGGASGNPVVFSVVSGPGTVSGTNGSTLTYTGVGTVVVAADQAGNTNFSPAPTVTRSVVVNQATQVITFTQPATPATIGTSVTLSATGGASGNPVVFSVVSGPGTVSGTNGSTLSYTGAGTVVIAANQAGNANYAAAPQVTRSVTVSQTAQTIAFTQPTTPATFGTSVILAATGGASGNPVTFSVVSGPATVSGINGSTLTYTGVGTVVVAADQAGNANFSAAPQVTRSVVVAQATQAIGFTQPVSPAGVGDTATLVATGGASGSPVIFSVVSGPATVSGINGSTITYTGAGTVVIAANQAGTANYSPAPQVTRSVIVSQTAQTINFTQPATPATFGTSVTLVATGGASGNPVTFSVVSGPGTVSGTNGSTLTYTGVGTVVVAADQAGNANFGGASTVTQSVVVNPAAQTITFPQPVTPAAIGSTATLSATGGASGNPVVFSVLSGPASVSGTNGSTITYTGADTVVIAANQTGSANYAAAAQVMRSVTVSQTAQTINFTQPTTPVMVGATATLVATGGASGNPVIFSISGGAATVSGTNGSTITYTGVGLVDISAQQAGNTNFSAGIAFRQVNVTQATQTITFNQPATPVAVGSTATLSATGGASGNPVVFSVVSGPATVSGTNGSTITYSAAGTVVIAADQAGNANYLAAPTVTQTVVVSSSSSSFNAGTLAVGASSGTLTATVNLTGSGAGAGPSGVSVVTQGIVGLDFNVVTGGTCAGTTSFTAGQSCTVTYTFAPTHPGTRYGAVVVRSQAGAVLGTAYLFGTGTGPLVTFLPASGAPQIALGGGFTYPTAVTVDAAGNAFVNEQTTNVVKKVPAGCTSSSCVTTVGGGFTAPNSLALDGAGNLYVGDFTTNTVRVVAPGCTSASCVTTVGGGYQFIEQVAVDTAGKVYVANLDSKSIVVAPAGCTSASCTSTLGGGYSRPEGVAVGSDGTVYVADNGTGENDGSGKILQFPSTCQSASCVTTRYATPQPYHLAVDGENNLYFTTFNGNSIQKLPAGCSNASCVVTIAGADAGTFSVAVDGSNNVYVTDAYTASVTELDLHDPPALTFTSTPAGTQSAQQVVTLTNSGNATALAISALTGTNANFNGAATTCAVGTPVAAGASCVLGVQFAPAAAGNPVTGSASITDNNLNVAGSVQSLGISGVATSTMKTITFAPLASPVALGSTATLMATASNGDPVTFSVLTGNATISGATVTYTSAGIVMIAANSAANGNFTAAPQVTQTVTVNQATQTISFTAPASPAAVGTSVTLVATGGASGNPVLFSVMSGPATVNGSTLTYTGAGTVVVAANQAGNANYSAAPQSTRTVTVGQTAQTISFTAPASPAAIGTSVTLVATGGASGNPVVFSVVSGPATVSGSTLTYTGAGTVVVAANQAGNANYSAAPQVMQTVVVGQTAQTISFTPTASPVVMGTSATLAATGGASGNPVVFSVVSGPATVSGVNGSTLTYTGPGTVVVAANQAGNANYSAAPQVTQSVVVTQGTQTISFTGPASPAALGTSVALTATGGASGNPIVFSVLSGPGIVSGPNGSTLTYTGAGTVLVAANQAGNANYTAAPQVTQSVVVTQGTQTISFTAPVSPAAIGTSVTLTATGGASGSPVVFSLVSGPATIAGSTLTYTGAGTVVVAANQAGNTNYTAAPQVTQTVIVSQTAQTISFTAPPSPATFSTSVTLAATGGASGNPVVFTLVSGPGTLSGTNNSTLTYTGAGTVVIAANQAGNTNFSAAPQVTQSVIVSQTAQAISFMAPASPATIGTSVTLAATGGASANPVVFSVVSGPATVSGANGSTLTYTGAGTVVVAANQAGNVNYSAAPQVTQSVIVSQTAQTINFTAPASPAVIGGSVTLVATGGASGTPVTFSVVSGSATVSGPNGATLTYTGAGTVVVAANQAGNANYSAAPQVTQTVTVSQTTQTISFTAPASPAALNSSVTLTATGGASGNAVVFTVVSGPATVSGANGATLTYTGSGTVVVAANQVGNVNYSAAPQVTQTVTVSQSVQTITFTAPATPAAIGATATLIATGGASGNPVIFSVVSGPATVSGPNGSTVTYTAAGTVLLAANQAGGANYTAAPQVTQTVVVSQSAQTIVFTQPASPASIGTSVTLVATGGDSGSPVVFSLVSGPATVSGVNGSTLTYTGAGTVIVAANQAGNANFNAATAVTRTVTVGQTAQTISFTPPASPAAIGTSATLVATGGASGLPVVFTVVSGPATVSGANGSTLTYSAAGTVIIAANQASNTNFSAAPQVTQTVTVGKATPNITWANPADVVAGTTLSATQLNATATDVSGAALPGTYVYTPASGTVLTAGVKTLSLTFTPNDTANYTVTTKTVQLNVIAVTLTSLSTTAALLGDPAKTITLTGTGFVSNSVVTADGSPVATTFVNGTTLTAIIPAASFTTVHSIPVFVTDPTQAQTTSTLTITVAAAPLTATVTAPSTTTPGAQPTVTFTLTNTYPVPVTAVFTMTFTPAAGLPNDPTVLFSNGTRTVTVVIPAGSSTPVSLALQSGSVAGTITITSAFTGGGVTLTPTGGAQTVTISSPAAVPGISSTTLVRSGKTLTVTTLIYSNTRAVDHVNFHFVAAAGQKIGTPDVTVDGSLFTTYYASAASLPYGSAAVYTQTFTLDEDASVVGEVDVTVVNAIGNSQAGSAK